MYSIVIQLGAILCLPSISVSGIRNFCVLSAVRRGDRTVLTHPLGLVMTAFV